MFRPIKINNRQTHHIENDYIIYKITSKMLSLSIDFFIKFCKIYTYLELIFYFIFSNLVAILKLTAANLNGSYRP